MASGKKNYFRHSAAARMDEKIVNLISKHGKEAYFHYFALLEMCAQKALSEDLNGDETFVFHKRTVCAELMVTPQRLGRHLLAIQSSLLGDLVETPEGVKIKFPKLPKYLGRYDDKKQSKTPNKRKEKERKEKESSYATEHPATPCEIPITPDQLVQLFNEKFRGKLKPSPGLGSGIHLQNFFATCRLLKSRSDWENLLAIAAEQDWLIRGGKVPLTLTWLVVEENAIKVLEGKYGDSIAKEDEMLKEFFGGAV